MKFYSFAVSMLLVLTLLVSLTACSPVDTASKADSTESSSKIDQTSDISSVVPAVHSTDSVMSTFFNISLFDEENYSNVFLGEDFAFEATYAGVPFTAPMKISDLTANGWKLISGQNLDSSVLALGSVDLVFENDQQKKLSALLFNAAEKSVKLADCNIVKFHFDNDFYKNPNDYTAFQVNGLKNGMAVTDIIDVLGTPSHFYRTAADNYYLDYSISKKDRRNGIRVYINPQEDNITAVEIAFYE